MGKFIDIKFLPAPRNDGGGQAAGSKLKSMASSAREEKPGYEGVFSGRPIEMQQVVEVLDVWNSESSWRAKEESPEQAQVRKLLDELCEGAELDLSSLAAFKNQYLMEDNFDFSEDKPLMKLWLFLAPTSLDEFRFSQGIKNSFNSIPVNTGWGLRETTHNGRSCRGFLVLSNWENMTQAEIATTEIDSSLASMLSCYQAITLKVLNPALQLNNLVTFSHTNWLQHHIKWKNPLAQAGLAVSGGMNQTA